MNIAEQVTQLKADFDEVKQAGYIKGEEAGRTAGYNYGWEQGLQQGVADGKQAERHALWGILQKNGAESGLSYIHAFSYGKFTDENYNPEHPIYIITGNSTADSIFYNAYNITDVKVPIYCKASRMSQTFGNSGVVTIPYLEVLETTTYLNAFFNCKDLVNLTMGGTIGQNGFDTRYSTKLSKASHISVINVLSTTTSGLTVTFSKTAVNKAFETSEGAADGSTSDEWTALIATKPNWTINLA